MDPIELQQLKNKLANLSCECHSCIKRKPLLDKGVQVDKPRRRGLDEFTQADPDIITKDHNNFLNTLTKDVLCPSCYYTMNLLRGGALKVLKDQDSETEKQMFSCDKTVGLEKSTLADRRFNWSSITFSDYLTEEGSSISLEPCFYEKLRVPEREVKYRDVGINEVHRDELIHGHIGLCLDNYIDSIRSPLNGFLNTNRDK